jgi:hypothetical protein
MRCDADSIAVATHLTAIPDTLEDVWVMTALGAAEEAKRRIDGVPLRHPFELRYDNDVPTSYWKRCMQVLDKHDVLRRQSPTR